MSGKRASYGRDALNGILAAVEKINRSGGLDGRQIDLIVIDNLSMPEETLEAVARFDERGVVAIIGPLASRNALVASREAQERGIPIVLPAATLGGVTSPGEYVSRICFTNEFQGRVLAHFAVTFLKAKTFALVTETGSFYSRELARYFVNAVESSGCRITWRGEYRSRQEDFHDLVASLRTVEADAVFLPGYYGEVRAFLEQARESGLEIPVLGGDGWDVPFLADSPRGVSTDNYCGAHFAPDEPTEAVAEFTRHYTTKYGYAPHSLAALGYDSIWFVTDAVGRSSGGGREDLKNAINSTRGFRGLTGTLSLDAKRDGVKSAVILKTTPLGFDFIDRIDPRAVGVEDTLYTPVPVETLSS